MYSAMAVACRYIIRGKLGKYKGVIYQRNQSSRRKGGDGSVEKSMGKDEERSTINIINNASYSLYHHKLSDVYHSAESL